jgi:hypothetical protein
MDPRTLVYGEEEIRSHLLYKYNMKARLAPWG